MPDKTLRKRWLESKCPFKCGINSLGVVLEFGRRWTNARVTQHQPLTDLAGHQALLDALPIYFKRSLSFKLRGGSFSPVCR